jgi:hypothetical protein
VTGYGVDDWCSTSGNGNDFLFGTAMCSFEYPCNRLFQATRVVPSVWRVSRIGVLIDCGALRDSRKCIVLSVVMKMLKQVEQSGT